MALMSGAVPMMMNPRYSARKNSPKKRKPGRKSSFAKVRSIFWCAALPKREESKMVAEGAAAIRPSQENLFYFMPLKYCA